jgi:hypothetical protein
MKKKVDTSSKACRIRAPDVEEVVARLQFQLGNEVSKIDFEFI